MEPETMHYVNQQSNPDSVLYNQDLFFQNADGYYKTEYQSLLTKLSQKVGTALKEKSPKNLWDKFSNWVTSLGKPKEAETALHVLEKLANRLNQEYQRLKDTLNQKYGERESADTAKLIALKETVSSDADTIIREVTTTESVEDYI
jgi:predicted nuclease with TOPRIM domain